MVHFFSLFGVFKKFSGRAKMSGVVCADCDISLAKKAPREKRFRDGHLICIKCDVKARRDSLNISSNSSVSVDSGQSENITDEEEEMDEKTEQPEKEQYVKLSSLKSTIKSHRQCIFKCGNVVEKNLVYINRKLRCDMLIKHKIVIPKKCCCCPAHFSDDGSFDHDSVVQLEAACEKESFFSVSEIDTLFSILIDLQKSSGDSSDSVESDYFENLTDGNIKMWTGVHKNQFSEMCSHIPRNDSSLLLGVYLMHLYAGLTQKEIGAIIGTSQPTVSRLIIKCRNSLNENFVPLFVGNVSREQIQSNTSAISKILNGVKDGEGTVITIWDGTYLFLHKSINFRFQRVTYSGHKKRNYVKPMIACTTTGLIVDVFGPDVLWAGNVSDADILTHVMKLPVFTNFFKPKDVFILDRGFERVKEALEAKGYVVSIPCLNKSNAQLTTLEANTSRLCTKQRWVVEAVNSSLKRFSYFKNNVMSTQVPHLYTDFRIAAAIHNAYFRRLYSDDDDPQIAQIMLNNLNLPNQLQGIVEKESLIRKTKCFERMSEKHHELFNVWTYQDFQKFSGTYQLYLAKSYVADHLYEGKYEFFISKDNHIPDFAAYNIPVTSPIFVKAKLVSRHKKSKMYAIFILIDFAKPSKNSVVAHFCTCKNGSRTIGCCAHILAVIWFLGCGRHEENFTGPSDFLNRHFPLLKPTAEDSEEDSENDAETA